MNIATSRHKAAWFLAAGLGFLLTLGACTQELYAGNQVARRFLKVDKLSTAMGTDDSKPREYRFGYGVLDENLNGQVDAGEKRVYFEVPNFATYVFFDNPH